MMRTWSLVNLESMRSKTIPFRGDWEEAFGHPEKGGCWIIFGKAGSGSIVKLTSSVDNKEYEGVIVSTKPIPEKGMNSVRIAVNNKGKNTLISVGSYVNVKVTKKKASQDLIDSLKNIQQESKKDVLTAAKEEADKKVQEIIGEILK